MALRFHKGALLLGGLMGAAGAFLMILFILEFEAIIEGGGLVLVFPAFFLWLLIPIVLARAIRRDEEKE